MVVELQYAQRPVFAREICLARIEPGRKLVELYVELPNMPTALAELFNVLARHNASVSSMSSYIMHNKLVNFIIVDLSYARSSIDEILDEVKYGMRISPTRVECYVPEIEGVITEKFGFPPIAGSCGDGQELLVLRGSTFSSMLKTIKDLFGTGGDIIILQQAIQGGVDTAKNIEKMFSKTYVPPDFPFKLHLDVLTAFGFGIFEIADKDRQRIVVRVEESVESRYLRRRYDTAKCVFIKGYLKGAIEEHYGRRVFVEETRCIAKGDPYCEFVAKFE